MQRTMLSNRHDYSWAIDIFFLSLILTVLFFALLGTRPLFVPDEGRYAEIVREMAVLGDYITPHLNGIKYFEKPILFYWLGTAAIKVAGINLWSIRSINALLGLIGCLFTYFMGRKLYNRTTGILASLILGTSSLYFVMSHMISLDLTVTLFLTISLYTFLLGLIKPPGIARRLYLWSAFASAALAVLTKGLIGIVFPLMIIGAWVILMNEWRSLKRLYLPSSLFIFLIITTPWHILVGIRNPEFFYFYFIEQHFLRYTTSDIGHYQPAWFFIPVLILGFFPWVVFLPQAIARFCQSWKRRDEYKIELFFLLWALLIFIFFSFSKSKLIPYILPVLPPLAILVARYLEQAIKKGQTIGIKIGYACLLLTSCVIAYFFYLFPSQSSLVDQNTAILYLNIAALVLMSGTIIGCIYVYRNSRKAILLTLVTSFLFLLISLAAAPAIDTRTILPLAAILNSQLEPEDEVVTFNQYYQDLPFYLKRKVSILNWRNELAYGMRYQDTREWMIDDSTFWQRWHSKKRVFVIMGLQEYKQVQKKHPKEHFYLLGKTPYNLLISNS